VNRIGYARVSTADQDPELQQAALRKSACERIFTDRASGARADRPELNKVFEYLRPGDTLVVWKLDRLGRNLSHLVSLLSLMSSRGIEFVSLTEGIDTTTTMGRLMFHINASFAEFERELIRERTMAGLAAARAAGRTGGRPRALTAVKVQAAKNLRASGNSVSEIAKILRVGTSTVYRALDSA
jgi:DNA invertase Pin-like site-specific DNA recombinase